MEYHLEESLNQSQILKNQNQELIKANASAKNDYDDLFQQKRNADKEITRLEAHCSELQMNFTSQQQKLKLEIARLEGHAVNLNSQIESGNKQIESLTNQIETSNENARKLENQIANLSRELLCKADELERLAINMQFVRDTNGELDKSNREKETALTEQMNELEHMKCEVNDARHQLQHCLTEVSFSLDLKVKISTGFK